MSVEKTKIYPINTGWVILDHAVYLFNKGTPGKNVDIPNICFYVDTGEHKLMIDTGLPDAERATKYHHDCTKRGCPDSPDALKSMGVDPDEIDICIFTHLHWDHCHNMKKYRKARYIVSQTEIQWAYNPLPPYYRSYEAPILGVEPPFQGCQFEVVNGETEIVPGVRVFPTPGHTPGHIAAQVETTAGSCVVVGDAIFTYRNFEPRIEEHWRYWVETRLVNQIDGWKSMEEIDRRADFILPFHEERVLEHPVYPYDGMPLRVRRQPIPGAPFYFSGI
jgi:N-acyl homoserine lactone hydrolase